MQMTPSRRRAAMREAMSLFLLRSFEWRLAASVSLFRRVKVFAVRRRAATGVFIQLFQWKWKCDRCSLLEVEKLATDTHVPSQLPLHSSLSCSLPKHFPACLPWGRSLSGCSSLRRNTFHTAYDPYMHYNYSPFTMTGINQQTLHVFLLYRAHPVIFSNPMNCNHFVFPWNISSCQWKSTYSCSDKHMIISPTLCSLYIL